MVHDLARETGHDWTDHNQRGHNLLPLNDGGGFLYGITSGPDGNIWFTDGGRIANITPEGKVSRFSGPTSTTSVITAGPDGALWYTNDYNNTVVQVTTSGTFTASPVPA